MRLNTRARSFVKFALPSLKNQRANRKAAGALNAIVGRRDAFTRVSDHVAALIGALAGAAVIPLRGVSSSRVHRLCEFVDLGID